MTLIEIKDLAIKDGIENLGLANAFHDDVAAPFRVLTVNASKKGPLSTDAFDVSYASDAFPHHDLEAVDCISLLAHR